MLSEDQYTKIQKVLDNWNPVLPGSVEITYLRDDLYRVTMTRNTIGIIKQTKQFMVRL